MHRIRARAPAQRHRPELLPPPSGLYASSGSDMEEFDSEDFSTSEEDEDYVPSGVFGSRGGRASGPASRAPHSWLSRPEACARGGSVPPSSWASAGRRPLLQRGNRHVNTVLSLGTLVGRARTTPLL
ncbi:hypothetical protein P7K49_036768 [Saguinus oedipus]|uniref:Uncharacterized protein n=1 Tax=Saguinus oedipus TaxID=9490 RepID=A0ABQ9TL54_SAGOE|nr:hypothetical protein P7K49_036768 [Saguinus oedipus]